MKVEIRPIEKKNTWHNVKGAEAENFIQDKVIEALINPETGLYETGLTEEETEKYSKKLNVNLDPKMSLDNKPHPFYGSKQGWLRLPYKTIVFDDTKPLDFIKIKLAKASKFVANSVKEYEDGLYPEANHVIYSEEEDIQAKASKIQKKNKATKIAMNLTKSDKVNIIQVMKNKDVKDRSQDFIDVIIDDIINEEQDVFIKYANMDKAEVYTRARIMEAISKNVLTKEGTSIYYMGDLLGIDIDEAVKYFMDPNNQKQKILILEKINNK